MIKVITESPPTAPGAPSHVPSFVVVADGPEGKPYELGQFYRVADADDFLAGLDARRWLNLRIEPHVVAWSDVPPAHRGIFEGAK